MGTPALRTCQSNGRMAETSAVMWGPVHGQRNWSENNRYFIVTTICWKPHPKLPTSPDPHTFPLFSSSASAQPSSPQMQMDTTCAPLDSQQPSPPFTPHTVAYFLTQPPLAISTNKIKQGESCHDKKGQRDFKVILAEERCGAQRCFNLPRLALLACTKSHHCLQANGPSPLHNGSTVHGQRQQALSVL